MIEELATPEAFKVCPLCGERWKTLEDFVRDRSLVVNGYMAVFDDPGSGLVFVTHNVPACHTTLSVRAAELRPLYHGPEHEQLRRGADDCRRLCQDFYRLEECDAPCAMAWVRQVLQCLRQHEVPPRTVEVMV